MTVVLVEIRNFEALADGHGRLEAARALKIVGQWLKEGVPGPGCLARVDRGRLGLVMPRETLESAQKAVDLVMTRSGQYEEWDLPKLNLAFGLSGFPGDFQDETGPPENRVPLDSDPAGLLIARAELALHHAGTHREKRIFTYKDVIFHAGRVVQTLPYGRVVVNLGRKAGAGEGQVFIVEEAGPGEGAAYKGEVALFEVHDDYALGEVVSLRSSLDQLQPGDRLSFSRRSIKDPAVPEKSGEGLLDPLLGIPDHQAFKEHLLERMTRESDPDYAFAVIMVQVDGYDRYRFTMGRLESDRQFKALYGLLQEKMAENCLVGRYSSDSLCIFCPDLDETQALKLAQTWRDMAAGRHRQTVTIGVAAFPCGPFSRLDVLSNAQKALEHATFFGPSSVAAFDSVSLNISGDKRFETGDHEGAIAEYLNALELNPQDLNVLNSLGVCYGHIQKHDLAKETFHKVLAIDPQNLMAHYNLGFALAMDGQHQQALESFRQAAASDPKNFDILFQMGKMALELDLIDEALGCFEQAAALKSRRPSVFRYLGQTLLKAERVMEAIDAFKAAVRHDPEDAPSLSQLGILFLERGTDLDVALSLTSQSVELDPSNSLFRQRRARVLAASGELEDAEIEYDKVLEMGTCTREVYYEIGRVAQVLGHRDRAEKWFKASLEQDKEFKPALEALAEMARKDSENQAG